MTSAIGMANGMNDVQRFDFYYGYDGYVDCSDAGEYVRYCDYVALQQQLAAAREDMARTDALITKWRDASAYWHECHLGDDQAEACASISTTYADCADDLAASMERAIPGPCSDYPNCPNRAGAS